MELQKTISAEKCSDMNGKTIRVIVDGKFPKRAYIAAEVIKTHPT